MLNHKGSIWSSGISHGASLHGVMKASSHIILLNASQDEMKKNRS
jgi:hypothetical protein